MTTLSFEHLVTLVRDKMAQFPNTTQWWVAYSGGLDSTVLLHLCAEAIKRQQLETPKTQQLKAIHINHQLQPEANTWASHCLQTCQQLGVGVEVVSVDIEPARKEKGLEAAAREARYQAFADKMGAADGLLMAHHLDDQAETFMLRLMRGSGVNGLSAIPESRNLASGFLLRPLLSVSKSDLEGYARAHQLAWIEDPSNQSEQFDRNFIRQQVMPLLQQRWPDVAGSMSKSARLCEQSNSLNQQLAETDWQLLKIESLAGTGIQLSKLECLSEERQVNVIRYWLSQHVDYLPDGETVLLWLSQFFSAAEDAMPQITWRDKVLRRFQQGIYLTPLDQLGPDTLDIHVPSEVYSLGGSCSVRAMTGLGVRWAIDQTLQISFRPYQVLANEKIYLTGRTGSRTLKKIFQEQAVPYWLRSQWPVLLVEGEPAAMLGFDKGLLVFEGFSALDEELGVWVDWRFT